MSKGQNIVGVRFDTSNDEQVKKIKDKFAELIDLVDSLDGDPRRKAIAITNIETGQMFAVKSIFTK